jgi:hypothetical protein
MFNPKVLNANMPNSVTPMRSGEFQPRFIAGGNQTAYYLGIKGNNVTADIPKTDCYSCYEKIIKKHRKK